MNLSLLSPIRYLLNAIRGERTRHQLALGFALGVIIGLLPKGNFTAAAFTTILLATRVNIGMGLFTAAAVSWIAPGFDPLTDRIGRGILLHEAWQEQFAAWYQIPLVPWFGLHNTVVLGSFILGSVLFLPAYFVSQPLFSYWAKDELPDPTDSASPPDAAQRPSEEKAV